MLILQRPWTRQPQTAVRLSAAAPAGAFAYIGGSGALAGVDAPIVLGGTINIAPDGGDTRFASQGTTSSYILTGKTAYAVPGTTWVMQFLKRTLSARYAAGVVETGTSYIEDVQINASGLLQSVNQNRASLSFRSVAGADLDSPLFIDGLVSDFLHTVVFTIDGTSSGRSWANGVLMQSSTGTMPSTAGTCSYSLSLLNRNVRGAFSSSAAGVYISLFYRAPKLTFDPIRASINPWAELFAPSSIYIPSAAAAATVPTLSAATYVTGSITTTGWRPQVTAS